MSKKERTGKEFENIFGGEIPTKEDRIKRLEEKLRITTEDIKFNYDEIRKENDALKIPLEGADFEMVGKRAAHIGQCVQSIRMLEFNKKVYENSLKELREE